MRARWLSLIVGLIIVSSLITVDPGAFALLNVEFLVCAGSVAMAMQRQWLRVLWHRILIDDCVVMMRVGWRMTRESPRDIIKVS